MKSRSGWLQSLHSSFDHWFPVEIRGPVHQVEGPKQHREHYPGHLVNLAHAVVSLFGVRGLGLRGFELYCRAVWDGSDGRVLREVGCIIHAGRTGVVRLFRQSQRVLLLWGERNTIRTKAGKHKENRKMVGAGWESGSASLSDNELALCRNTGCRLLCEFIDLNFYILPDPSHTLWDFWGWLFHFTFPPCTLLLLYHEEVTQKRERVNCYYNMQPTLGFKATVMLKPRKQLCL